MRKWPLLILCIYAVVTIVGLKQYICWTSAGFILGIIALPVTASFNHYAKGSPRFFWASLCFFVLFMLIPAKTFLYLSVAAAGLFFAEIFYGRINLLPQLVLIGMSPWANTIADLFSFPIRLQLTHVAGILLGVQTQGNMITFNGNEFSVDPACMGLQMIITSLLCGIILLGIYQKRMDKVLKGWQVISILVLIIFLNIIANLFRIVCLVQFNILPGTFMHEAMGLICLLGYVIIPVMLLIRWAVNRYGSIKKNHRGTYYIRSASGMLLRNSILAVCLLIAMVHQKIDDKMPSDIPQIAGYHAQPLPGNVIKLENGHSLVYIKHIPGCYYTEHHPMICWKGSGYVFQRVQERRVEGSMIYTALLQQGSDILYTAWWYENGQESTTSQLQWRWDVFRGGHPYSLVNVTAANELQLEKEIENIKHLKSFRLLL